MKHHEEGCNNGYPGIKEAMTPTSLPTQPTVEEVAEHIALLQERFMTRPKRSNSFAVYAESNADCKAMLALLSALEKDAEDAARYRVFKRAWVDREYAMLHGFTLAHDEASLDAAIDLARGQL